MANTAAVYARIEPELKNEVDRNGLKGALMEYLSIKRHLKIGALLAIWQ